MNLPDDILGQLKDHEQRLNAMERYPRATSVQSSNVGETVFSLGATGTSTDMTLAWFTLHNDNNALVMGSPRMLIYRDMTQTLDGSNIWPLGSRWTAADLRAFDVMPYCLYGSIAPSEANDLQYAVFFRNRGTTALNSIGVFVDWRLPLLSGANV
jgi:hypothetical protein